MAVFHITVAQAIVFKQSNTSPQKGGVVRQSLTFTETIGNNIKVISVYQELFFRQVAATQNKINLSVSQEIVFQSRGTKSHREDIYQNLYIYQRVNNNPLYNKLTFIETIDVDVCKPAKNKLNFVQSVVLAKSLRKTITQTLVFRSTATAYINDVNYFGQIIDNPPTGFFQGGGWPKITFSAAGGYSVTLPAPEFDDSNPIELTRINRKSRGGDLIVFRDPMWPISEKLNMRWDHLSQKELRDFQFFIKTHLAEAINIFTHEGRTFNAIFSKVDGGGAQKGREWFSAAVEMEVI